MDRSFTQNKEIPKVGQTCGDRCPVTCSQHSSRYTGTFFYLIEFFWGDSDMFKRLIC